MRIEPPRRAPADEQRLIVLYSLMNLGPCTETQLLQFLSEMDLTNYFDMMFALNELCDRGQAARQKRKDGTYYMATVAGDEALRLFGKRVPQSLKTAVQEQGDAWRARFRTAAQRATFSPPPETDQVSRTEISDPLPVTKRASPVTVPSSSVIRS